MNIGRTANPALNKNTFKIGNLSDTSSVMTISGTVNKTFIMLLFLMGSATWTWNTFMAAGDFAAVARRMAGRVGVSPLGPKGRLERATVWVDLPQPVPPFVPQPTGIEATISATFR